jgi:hypothetical protein
MAALALPPVSEDIKELVRLCQSELREDLQGKSLLLGQLGSWTRTIRIEVWTGPRYGMMREKAIHAVEIKRRMCFALT